MGQKTMLLAIGLIIFTVIISALLVVGRIRSGSKTVKLPAIPTATRNVVPVDEIIDSPLVYNGYSLEVDSQITDWVTSKSFTFAGGTRGAFGGGTRKQLLVIAQRPFQLPQDSKDDKLGLGEKAKVSAKGNIRILNREDLQRALGIDLDGPEIALDNNNINRWEEGPVLFLTSVEINDTIK